jgi:poly-gamma-glutamate capsule biosynthesis protein CapA/YwtB (metallophosphatase superfamily)
MNGSKSRIAISPHSANVFCQGVRAPSFDAIGTIAGRRSLSLLPQGVGDVITLVAAGDVEWSGLGMDYDIWCTETLFKDAGEMTTGWPAIPRVINPETRARLQSSDPAVLERYAEKFADSERLLQRIREHFGQKALHHLKFESIEDWATFPFRRIRSTFREADIAFLNLETPLSSTAFRVGSFMTPPEFTLGLTDVGLTLVSLANNHMLDAEVRGLVDTMGALDAAGILYVGAGLDLARARSPQIVKRSGITVGFLAYTQQENHDGFANSLRPGVAPMDPLLIADDIARLKGSVDHVIVSLHWDSYEYEREQMNVAHREAVEFAHQLIDRGASAILGHHPHVPRAVEYYRGAPILYSMGHLIFGGAHPWWDDNFIARLCIGKEAIARVELLPTAGRMIELAQPWIVDGQRARDLILRLQQLSEGFGGTLRDEGGIGVLTEH